MISLKSKNNYSAKSGGRQEQEEDKLVRWNYEIKTENIIYFLIYSVLASKKFFVLCFVVRMGRCCGVFVDGN